MRTLCFFLCYRKRANKRIRWSHPTGGLVMEPECIVNGIPKADLRLAGEVLEQRYHCEGDEELIVAEVFQRKEMKLAKRLHQEWEEDMVSFKELMNVS